MSELRDFLQSMNNAVAGNVSGPVDGLAWLLKRAGVPVGTPVGGSDWMAEKGLTRPVKQSAQQVLGETAGLLAPMAFTKSGLQAMIDAVKATKNMPVGLGTVWHGSPHKFDKFDASKIGTGEGAQAYGHGLYFAESPDVAKNYTGATGVGKASETMLRGRAEKVLKNPSAYAASDVEWAGKTLDQLNSRAGDQLYKVDLPDEQIAKMLDWDKPLSEQPKAVKDAYKKYLKSPQASEHAKSWTRYSDGMRLDQAEPLLKNPGGENLYKNAFPSREAANQWALENGIPGIRYLDGGSRGTGGGTSNFVVFPGNEGMLKILERNGKGLLE